MLTREQLSPWETRKCEPWAMRNSDPWAKDKACLWPMWTKEMWRTIYGSDEQQILPNSRYMFPFIQLINWITGNQVLIHQPHGERERVHLPFTSTFASKEHVVHIQIFHQRLFLSIALNIIEPGWIFYQFLARKRIDLWWLLFLWFPTKIGLHLQQKIHLYH